MSGVDPHLVPGRIDRYPLTPIVDLGSRVPREERLDVLHVQQAADLAGG